MRSIVSLFNTSFDPAVCVPGEYPDRRSLNFGRDADPLGAWPAGHRGLLRVHTVHGSLQDRETGEVAFSGMRLWRPRASEDPYAGLPRALQLLEPGRDSRSVLPGYLYHRYRTLMSREYRFAVAAGHRTDEPEGRPWWSTYAFFGKAHPLLAPAFPEPWAAPFKAGLPKGRTRNTAPLWEALWAPWALDIAAAGWLHGGCFPMIGVPPRESLAELWALWVAYVPQKWSLGLRSFSWTDRPECFLDAFDALVARDFGPTRVGREFGGAYSLALLIGFLTAALWRLVEVAGREDLRLLAVCSPALPDWVLARSRSRAPELTRKRAVLPLAHAYHPRGPWNPYLPDPEGRPDVARQNRVWQRISWVDALVCRETLGLSICNAPALHRIPVTGLFRCAAAVYEFGT